MNPRMAEAYGILEMTTNLRNELMMWLTDENLAFAPPGNPKLGVLCRQIGEIQQSYTDSFKTYKQNWDYPAGNAAELESSVEKLKAWYAELDAEMKTAIAAVPDETTLIDRGGWHMSAGAQMHTYREALLIFYAKVSVYLLALGKTEMSEQWQHWIG